MSIYEIITPKTRLPVYIDKLQTYNQFIPSHWHNHLEVLYIFKGTMHISLNHEEYTIHSKDLFVVNSGDIHFTRSFGDVKFLLLQIPYELLDQCIPQFQTLRFSQYYPYEKLKEDTKYEDMILHLLSLWNLYEKAEGNYQFLFNSELYLFLHILYSQYSALETPEEKNKSAKHLGRLKIIIDYVEQNYQEPISLKEVAALVALNPEYFCRFFKKYMGFSFINYVNLVRLARIHDDILHSNDSITVIQERHGFTNYKIFNRMFKEAYGCTPSKLRDNK
jgi:AraC-like DNA-binding protein